MLDLATGTLHTCGPVHATTSCQVGPSTFVVGPMRVLANAEPCERWCAACFPDVPVGELL